MNPTLSPDPADSALLARIHQEIAQAGGWLPFSEWMHEVLYAPGLGYYAAGNTKLADSNANSTTKLSGDFVTAPQLTPLFGQTLAKQIAEVKQVSVEDVALATTTNTERLFRMPKAS